MIVSRMAAVSSRMVQAISGICPSAARYRGQDLCLPTAHRPGSVSRIAPDDGVSGRSGAHVRRDAHQGDAQSLETRSARVCELYDVIVLR